MTDYLLNQWTIAKVLEEDEFEKWVEVFLIDKKVQNLSPGTLHFYKSKLKLFLAYCQKISLHRISQLTPENIRDYLLHLKQLGHNPGGIHAAYRTLKTFLIWWEQEFDLEGWKNPIRKVKTPKTTVDPIKPVSLDVIDQLLATCSGDGLMDLRDKAMIYFLLDTGVRASEACGVNVDDMDLMSGSVLIRCGKGGKSRTVFIGKKTRRALRAYLKTLASKVIFQIEPALWVTNNNVRLSYWGLNQIIRRRAQTAQIKKPSLHDFRRAFALNFLRNGGDIFSLQHLMGHTDLQVLRRYLAQTTEDLQIAHQKYSPVEHSGL